MTFKRLKSAIVFLLHLNELDRALGGRLRKTYAVLSGRAQATPPPPGAVPQASSQAHMLVAEVARLSGGLVVGLNNPHIRLGSGRPLDQTIRELLGVPAPQPFTLIVDTVAGVPGPQAQIKQWRAFLAQRSPQLSARDLDRVAPILAEVGRDNSGRLEKLLSLRADPVLANQAGYFLNRFPNIYGDAVVTTQNHLAEAFETAGAAWATLFIALNFEILVVAHINDIFNPGAKERPSPFVYAMV